MSAESQLAADRDRKGEKKSDGRAKDRSDTTGWSSQVCSRQPGCPDKTLVVRLYLTDTCWVRLWLSSQFLSSSIFRKYLVSLEPSAMRRLSSAEGQRSWVYCTSQQKQNETERLTLIFQVPFLSVKSERRGENTSREDSKRLSEGRETKVSVARRHEWQLVRNRRRRD